LRDDKKAGIKSTAILFEPAIKKILLVFAFISVASFAYAGYCNDQGAAFYVVSVGGSALHLLWQITTLDPYDAENCRTRFKSNVGAGMLITAGLLVDWELLL